MRDASMSTAGLKINRQVIVPPDHSGAIYLIPKTDGMQHLLQENIIL